MSLEWEPVSQQMNGTLKCQHPEHSFGSVLLNAVAPVPRREQSISLWSDLCGVSE